MKTSNFLYFLICALICNTSFAGWQLQNPKFTGNINTCVWVNSNTAFLAGHYNILVKTTDGGETWQSKKNGITYDNVTPTIDLINFINEYTGYAVANQIYKTTNGGELWIPITQSSFWGKLSIPAEGVIYGFPRDGEARLSKSTDDGATWITLKNNIELNFAYVKFLNAQTGFYTNSPSINQKTTDGGATWVNVNISQTGQLTNLVSISFANENTGYSVMGGRLFKTTDKGLNWIQIYNPNTFDDISLTSENLIVAQTGGQFNPGMAKSFDGGQTWQAVKLPEYMYMKFYDESKGFGFYRNSTVYKISGLEDFQNISSKFDMTADITRIQAMSSQNAYALSSDNRLFYTKNGGNDWNRMMTNVYLKDFRFYNENFAVGATSDNIVTSGDGGLNWETKSSCANAKNFEVINQNTFYFLSKSGDKSYVRFSNDGGITNTILFQREDRNEGTSGISYSLKKLNFNSSAAGFLMMNEFSWWRLGSSYTCYILKTTNGGENWSTAYTAYNTTGEVFYINGAAAYLSTDRNLYKSTDFCETWSLVSNTSYITSLKFVNELTGYSAINGAVYKTVNGGESWALQQQDNNVRQIEMYDANIGYAAGSAGTIYHTENGGNVGVISVSSLVNHYSLSQNYPNPFNPATKINFSIPKGGLVQIKVYDLTGREVQTLLDEFKTPGEYRVDFDGINLSSGIYFYKLITNDFIEAKKMILVK